MLNFKKFITAYLKLIKNNNSLANNILFFSLIAILSGCTEDKTPPTITLVGNDEINWTQNYPYNDLGANAVDLVDGDTEVNLSGNVDVSLVGSYQMIYTATDSTGNKNSVTRQVNVVTPTSFITKWDTNGDITINTSGSGYDFSIDWGDGTVEHHQSQGSKHTYASAGVKTITISGIFPHFILNEADAKELLSVEQWGNNHWTSMERMFENASNMVLNAKDIPVLYQVSSMKRMFYKASAFNQYIGDWDVSNVRNMSGMFHGELGKTSGFNQEINGWNVSNVTDMSEMFSGNMSFNQSLNAWDLSNVINMNNMFYIATSFNQDISTWNVANVTVMRDMFNNALSFNQDISDWNVSNVTDMHGMFQNTQPFNQNISRWNVSNVTSMRGMFMGALQFNQDISNWDVSNVTDMNAMFAALDYLIYKSPYIGSMTFNQDLSDWNVSNVTNMDFMFSSTRLFNQDLSGWDVSNVDTMSFMFVDAGLSFENYDALLNGWSGKSSTKEITLQRGVSLGTSAFYSDASEDARDSLRYDHNWRIGSAGYIDTSEPDTTLPRIELNGEDTLKLSVGDDYVEYGAFGIDDRDGTFYASIKGEVDTNTPGKYILTYIPQDKAGNTTKAVTRTVTVK